MNSNMNAQMFVFYKCLKEYKVYLPYLCVKKQVWERERIVRKTKIN